MRKLLYKRWIAILTLVAFLGGSFALAIPAAATVTAQTCAMAMTSPAGDDGAIDQARGGGFKPIAPTCYDASGCILAKIVSFLPEMSAVPVVWVRVNYWDRTPLKVGRTIQPEHDPPIRLL